MSPYSPFPPVKECIVGLERLWFLMLLEPAWLSQVNRCNVYLFIYLEGLVEGGGGTAHASLIGKITGVV